MLHILVCVLLTVLPARADQADRIAEAEMAKQHIPGMSFGVMREGRLIKANGYGFANLELSVPATSETVYAIGSISKQFISAGILLLQDDGRLKLDDRLSRYIDEIPPHWNGVTVRQILAHTSGLPREAPGFSYFRPQPDLDVVRSAYNALLTFQPGEKWRYSNLGYFVLAEVIRRVAEQPWPQFLEDRIFEPLGMDATRVTTYSELVPGRADSYNWRNDHYTNAQALISVRPSGALLSNVVDLAKWDAALYSDTPLRAPLRQAAWTPVRLNDGNTAQYGLGWQLATYKGHRTVGHGGTIQGFKSHFLRFPDDELSVVVLANSSEGNPHHIAERLADLYLP